jgi:hypothetical protein
MYKIFKDKEKIFKCNVDVQGANIKDCKARLLFESEEGIFMLKGDIDKNGICKIKIPKEKMLQEGISGNVTLEVIAENTLFEAWNSEFLVSVDKKVKVNVVEDDFDELDKETEDDLTNESNQVEEPVEEINKLKVSAIVEEDIEEDIEEDLNELEVKEKVVETKIEETKTKPIVKKQIVSNKELKKEYIKEDRKYNDDELLNFDSFLNKK